MFAYFQDCRDAQAVSLNVSLIEVAAEMFKDLREDPIYRLEQPPKLPEDARPRSGTSRTHASPVSSFQRLSPARSLISPQAAMKRAADLCSVFVGNLPSDATDDKLRELFGMYGRIMHIEIVRKPSVNGKLLSVAAKSH